MTDDADNGNDHILLTVLGTDPKDATYSLDGKQKEARLAPVALMGLLPPDKRPHRVLAFCTAEAEEASLAIIRGALPAECAVDCVRVPLGDRQDDIDTFLTTAAEAIPPGAELTVDLTHGFRHFAVLMYVGVLYVAALKDVRVRAARYAMLGRDDAASPFLDLRPLLDLPRWVRALKVIQETGSTRPLAKIVRDGPDGARDMAQDFDDLADGYLSGLPLELGEKATRVHQQRGEIRKVLAKDHNLPLADNLVDDLKAILGRFALVKHEFGGEWKKDIVLDEAELERQAKVIDNLMEHRNTATGLGLMREWVINWAAVRTDNASYWLCRRTREQVERRLNAVTAVMRDRDLSDILTADQRRFGKFWDRLRQLRNGYHHHGMNPQEVGSSTKHLKKIRKYWGDALRSCPEITLDLGCSTSRRIVISPIGELPGVLFSTLHAYREQFGDYGDPDLCIVVCSVQTQSLVDEALAKAEYQGDSKRLILRDPFGDVLEVEEEIKKMRPAFVGAKQVVVNVTGGTTLMGIAAQKLADVARNLACPVRRLGLIDRRTREEQSSDPYQLGEVFWLDSKGHGDVH